MGKLAPPAPARSGPSCTRPQPGRFPSALPLTRPVTHARPNLNPSPTLALSLAANLQTAAPVALLLQGFGFSTPTIAAYCPSHDLHLARPGTADPRFTVTAHRGPAAPPERFRDTGSGRGHCFWSSRCRHRGGVHSAVVEADPGLHFPPPAARGPTLSQSRVGRGPCQFSLTVVHSLVVKPPTRAPPDTRLAS